MVSSYLKADFIYYHLSNNQGRKESAGTRETVIACLLSFLLYFFNTYLQSSQKARIVSQDCKIDSIDPGRDKRGQCLVLSCSEKSIDSELLRSHVYLTKLSFRSVYHFLLL